MYNEEFKSFSHAYPVLVRRAALGEKTSPRGIDTREITNVQFKVEYPNHIIRMKNRNVKYEIGALEACSLVGQFNVPEEFTSRVKKFAFFARHGVQWGSYGPRIAGDLGQVVDLLINDPASRQAVLTIFDSSRDINRGEPDIPCTIAVQFLFRNGALHMRTMMRSNDVWLGLPYDSIQFFALQSAVACALNVPIGEYYHNVGSLHLYEVDREKAMNVEYEVGKVFTYPFWGGTTISEISSTARSILLDKDFGRAFGTDTLTPFERWLHDQLHQ